MVLLLVNYKARNQWIACVEFGKQISTLTRVIKLIDDLFLIVEAEVKLNEKGAVFS